MNADVKESLIIGLVAAEIASAIRAWRDLDRRHDDQIRGVKTLWRAALIANPGNSIPYWLLGRR